MPTAITSPSMNDETKAEERHEDFESLNSTVRDVKKAIVAAILTGVISVGSMIISNHYGQKELTQQVATLNTNLSEMSKRFEALNEKVIILWSISNRQHQQENQ